MLNSPSARLSRIRLPRLGSIEVNSFASIAAAMIPAGLTLSPLVSRWEIVPDRLGRVEVRVEVQRALVEVEQRLADHRHLGGRAQPVRAGHPAELDEDGAGLELRPAAASATRCDLAAERPGVVVVERVAHPGEDGGHLLAVAVPIASSSLTTLSCRGATELTMPRSSSARRPSSVTIRLPGWVRVQDAVVEHQVEVAAEQLVDHRPGVEVEQPERADVGDLAPLDPVHREDAGGGVLHRRKRHHEQVVVLGQVGELEQVAGLAAVVQLGQRDAGTASSCSKPYLLPAWVCRSASPASRASVSMSSRAISGPRALDLDHDLAAAAGVAGAPGRARRRPGGSSSNSAKRWRIWPPSSASTISVTTSNPNGSASSWAAPARWCTPGAAGRSGSTAAGPA